MRILPLFGSGKRNKHQISKYKYVLLVLALVTVAGGIKVYADTGFTVSGTFAFDTSPVADQGYIYFSATSGSHGATYTNSNGVYSINNLSNDDYTAEISNTGSGDGKNSPRNFDVFSKYAINVSDADKANDFKFPVTKLSVTVRDSSGAIIPHIGVSAIANSNDTIKDDALNLYSVRSLSTSFSTNDNGIATLALLSGPSYNVCVTILSGQQKCQTVTVNGDTSVELNIPPAYNATGIVSFGDTPLAENNYVTISGADGTTKSVYADVNGQYAFSALSNGGYRFGFMTNGGDSVNIPRQINVKSSSQSLNINSDDVVKNFAFPKAQLSISLKDDNNNLLTNGQVTASASSGTVSDTAGDTFDVNGISSQKGTGSTGIASLAVLPGTTYHVCGLYDSIQKCDDVLVSGDSSITVRIPSPHTLSGTFSIGGNAVANQGYVSAIDSNDNFFNGYTDGSGSYSFNNLINGQYRFSLMNSGSGDGVKAPQNFYVASWSPVAAITGSDGTKDFDFPVAHLYVTVKDGSTLKLNQTVSATSQGGTVNDLAGESFSANSISTSSNTGSDGVATLPLIPGTTYSVCVYVNSTQQCQLVTLNGDQSTILGNNPIPNAPTNLTTTSPTKLYPSLDWSGSVGATSYNIYRNDSLVGSTLTTHFTDSTITSDGNFNYEVTAVNPNGESGKSNAAVVTYDTTAPSIIYTVTPVANASGWNQSSVLVAFSCADAGSGIASCASPIFVTNEGVGQTVVGIAIDNAGNAASVTAGPINVDISAPTLGTASFSANPILVGQDSTLTVPVSDGVSGVAKGEYFIGSADPGQGYATALTYADDNLAATFGNILAPGKYTINYRAEDVAGNWDMPQSTTLTVKPLAPTNLTASTPTNNVPTLNWHSVAGAEHYDVYRDGNKVGSPTDINYTDSTASEGVHDYYVVAVTGDDVAGDASSTVTVVYDTTKPTITYSVSPAANSNGYNNNAVTVTFSCDDTLSGVANCNSPVTLSTDGAHQTITGTTTDNAGNTATITTPDINIDTTAPTVTYTLSPVANANSWNKDDVTIAFHCSDATSGVDFCPSPVTLSTDGANQQVTGTATDKAGNSGSVTATVNIDKTAPTLGTPTWSLNTKLTTDMSTLTVPAADTLSGVSSGEYYIGTDPGQGNATAMNREGTNLTAAFGTNFQPGTYVVHVRAKDAAGNWSVITTTTLTVNAPDTTAPTVVGAPDRQPNANGWYSGNVTINWTATDPDSTATTPSPTSASIEGTNTYTSTQSCDPSNNCATGNLVLNIDKTAPTITYTLSPTPTTAGWNNSTVTVTFTCADLSGIQTCPAPVVVSTAGASQAFSGTAVDKAGNTASTTATVNIDKTAPTITYSAAPVANPSGWNNGNVTVTFSCGDSLSGIASCTAPITLSAEGSNQTATGTATDNAGNTSSVTAKVNIDVTAPLVGALSWSANPVAVGSNATLSAPTTDNLSGVSGGEYFIGSDPGAGNGTPMTYGSGSLSATFGSNLSMGVYTIGVRAKDNAGNWSPASTTMLVIYNPLSALGISGKNKKDLIPNLANGDIMPGLISNSQTDAADFGMAISYKNGALDSKSAFSLTYATGTQCGKAGASNCHNFALNATSIDWLVIDSTNSSRGTFRGTATVTIDGVTTTNLFTVQAIDGNLLTPSVSDSLVLKVYALGADPSISSPIYQATGFTPPTSGKSVVIK